MGFLLASHQKSRMHWLQSNTLAVHGRGQGPSIEAGARTSNLSNVGTRTQRSLVFEQHVSSTLRKLGSCAHNLISVTNKVLQHWRGRTTPGAKQWRAVRARAAGPQTMNTRSTSPVCSYGIQTRTR